MDSVRLDVVLAFDAQSIEGLVTLQGAGWNHLTVPRLPYAAPRLAVGVFLHIPRHQMSGKHIVTVRFEDPARQTIAFQHTDRGVVDRARVTIDLDASDMTSALLEHTIPLGLVFHDIRFEIQGVHRVVATYGDAMLREVPFDLRVDT